MRVVRGVKVKGFLIMMLGESVPVEGKCKEGLPFVGRRCEFLRSTFGFGSRSGGLGKLSLLAWGFGLVDLVRGIPLDRLAWEHDSSENDYTMSSASSLDSTPLLRFLVALV